MAVEQRYVTSLQILPSLFHEITNKWFVLLLLHQWIFRQLATVRL